MDVIRLLDRMAKQHGSQKALAKALKIHPTYLSMVMLGRKDPGPSLLKPLGLERVVTYRRKRQ